MAAGDIFELSVDQTYTGQNGVNVHHFTQVGADGTGDARTALFNVWNDNYRAALIAIIIADVNIVQVRIRRINPTQTQSLITAVGETGTRTNPGLPPHCAVLVRQRGFSTGRKGTGGTKIWGVSANQVANGRIDTLEADLYTAWGDLSESDITDGGTGYKFRAGVFSASDSSFRVIEKSQVTPRVVTVHSRQIGVGD